MVSPVELDLLALARAAAEAGNAKLRRCVMLLARKHRDSELGDHLRTVCLEHGVPVEVDRSHGCAIQSAEVLRAREALDRLTVMAAGDDEKLQDYRLALDFALGDFGARVAKGQLSILLHKGERDAAITIAAVMSHDARKSYADAGRQVLKAAEQD